MNVAGCGLRVTAARAVHYARGVPSGSSTHHATRSTFPPHPSTTSLHMIPPGSPAPDFTLPTDDGGAVTLSSLRRKYVVLFFYPKDETSG